MPIRNSENLPTVAAFLILIVLLAGFVPALIGNTTDIATQTITQTEGNEHQLSGYLSADLTNVRDGQTFTELSAIHTTDTDFNSADTLENVTVEGSGDSAYVNADFSTTFEDDFEDNDISDYNGETGSFSTQSNRAFSGSIGIVKDVGDDTHDGIYTNYDVYETSDEKNVSVWLYYGGSTNEDRGGVHLAESDGSGYSAYLIPSSGYIEIASRPDASSRGSALVTDSVGDIGEGWYQIFLAQDGNALTAKVVDDSGVEQATVQTTDSSHNPTRAGVWGFDTGTQFDLLQDQAGTSNVGGGTRAIYVGSTHSVNGAENGFANVSLSNSNAIITWQADTDGDGTFETEVSQTNESTSGNYTADLSSTSGQNFRVNVTFITQSDDATGELHDEGITSTTTSGTDINVILVDSNTGQTVETGPINESETRQFTIGFETVTITNEDVLSGERSLITYEYPRYYGYSPIVSQFGGLIGLIIIVIFVYLLYSIFFPEERQ